jgi:hypothetical protein
MASRRTVAPWTKGDPLGAQRVDHAAFSNFSLEAIQKLLPVRAVFTDSEAFNNCRLRRFKEF